MRDINWLAADVKDATFPNLYNFRQATDNRGSLIVNDLISSLKTPITRKSVEEEELLMIDFDINFSMFEEESDDLGSDSDIYVVVYPNPTDGIFTLEYEAQGVYVVTIADSFGKILMRRTVSDPKVEFNLNGFPSGMYLLTIEDGANKVSKKVIKN